MPLEVIKSAVMLEAMYSVFHSALEKAALRSYICACVMGSEADPCSVHAREATLSMPVSDGVDMSHALVCEGGGG